MNKSQMGRVPAIDYQSIFQNAIQGIFQSGLDCRFITANSSMARILGFDSPEELIASITDIRSQLFVEPAVADELIRDLATQGIVTEFMFEAYRQDDEKIWLSLNCRVVRDDAGKPCFHEGSIEDITHQREADAQRKQLDEQLRQSQKMDAIGLIAGGVAHDFNNLLTAINGYTNLALQRAPANDRIRGYLEQISKAGDRASNLTRQLLAFGRKQMLKPVALNLNDLVAEMEVMLRPMVGEKIEVQAKLDPALRTIKADPRQIEQVLINLVVNSRDAMPEGGCLTIETTNFGVDEQFASRHLGFSPGGYVLLAVSDTGCGMDLETRSRAFEPFFTTKEKGEGTGLGLSTVYGIVKQSGGNILVESEPDRGTTFRVFFRWLEAHAASGLICSFCSQAW